MGDPRSLLTAVLPLPGCKRRCFRGRRPRTPCSLSDRLAVVEEGGARGSGGCAWDGGWECRSLLSLHKDRFRQFSRKPSVFSLGGCCGLRGGEGNYCLALSKSGPFYKNRPDVESLSDPIKVKGGHLLAWLKGINGFYGIHRGMQIQALWQVWWQQIEIIDPFVSEGRAQWAAFLLNV